MTNKETVLSLVAQICNAKSTDCRSLNKVSLASELLDLAGVTEYTITEIPLDWDNQVVIIFHVNNEFKELFAGIGCDGKYYFEVTVCEDQGE